MGVFIMNYNLRKNNKFIYYNLDNFISDVPDIADVVISINHINNKRRLDIDILDNYIYSYRIYLDDYFNTKYLCIIDKYFGSSLSSNVNALYGDVRVVGHNLKSIKLRLSALKSFKLPKLVDLKDVLITMGWDDISWLKKLKTKI